MQNSLISPREIFDHSMPTNNHELKYDLFRENPATKGVKFIGAFEIKLINSRIDFNRATVEGNICWELIFTVSVN